MKYELLGFRADDGHLASGTHVTMRLEHKWDIADDNDEITFTLILSLYDKESNADLAVAAVAAKFEVPNIREQRNAIPDALYMWIGHSTYDTIRGVMLARSAGTVLEQIMLPLPPDRAFLPQAGFRSLSLN